MFDLFKDSNDAMHNVASSEHLICFGLCSVLNFTIISAEGDPFWQNTGMSLQITKQTVKKSMERKFDGKRITKISMVNLTKNDA